MCSPLWPALLVVFCSLHASEEKPIRHPGFFRGLLAEGICPLPHCKCEESAGLIVEIICHSGKLSEWPVEFDEQFSGLKVLNLAYNRGLMKTPSITSIESQFPRLEKLILTKTGLANNCHFSDMFRNYGITVVNPECPGTLKFNQS